MQLQDRLALVTGASSGIGAATARTLAGAGARLLLAARRRDRLDALRSELDGAEVIELDVRDADAVRSALEAHSVDIAIANAGLGLGLEPLQAGDPDDWAAMIDTNVKGVLHTVRAVLPGMIERGRGDVILLGSVAGRATYPGGNVYCASKFAVRGIYESLRVDLAGTGVRTSTIDPAMTETEFSEVRFKGDRERAAQVYTKIDPLKAQDVADAILFAVTRPAHVNVGELVLWPTEQASTTVFKRRS